MKREDDKMKALKNCHILTMAEKEYKNGIIIIEDGKIKEIGSKNEIKIPNKAEILDLEDKTVMPGMIDAHTHIGIDEEGIGWEGEDYNEKINPSTPHLRALDGINPRDQGLKDALNHGITTVMTGPGSANVIGGRSVVIKTKGENIDDMIIREPVGVKGAFGENPKKVYSEKEKSPTQGLRQKINGRSGTPSPGSRLQIYGGHFRSGCKRILSEIGIQVEKHLYDQKIK